MPIRLVAIAFWLSCAATTPGQAPQTPVLIGPIGDVKLQFDGVIGRQIAATTRQWLLRAPAANPGMLGMFKLRDRQPKPDLVPWAGEFVGKYLISAIQTLHMTEDAELERTVRAVVDELIASQANDGYLGPFPKEIRFTANWDLWGHYHCMLALLMWHERTGDARALSACTKAANLICRTFLDTGKRIVSVGSDEMNLAVIHALGRLYRKTHDPRHLAMMREIEKDWEKAGDYLRTGLASTEFHRGPRPRWESLHDLQGLVELYQITGDERYRRAFLHHWQSIRRWDRHNSGAFSSGEQATGDPYKNAAIETCCTVAWMAITVDALRVTGDPTAADELELSTFNGLMGALHPSGSWCTYSTPMNGVREASHQSIVFQARAGTPDLNCCSVNGPRGLGMLSEWALTQYPGGIAVNYYGPMQAKWTMPDGTAIAMTQETRYPVDGAIRIRLGLQKDAQFALKLRIPAWANAAKVQLPGAAPKPASPGTYVEARRVWRNGDEIILNFDLALRCESGDGEAFGRISIYRGPLLLAYDQRQNDFDEAQLPVLEPGMLSGARVSFPQRAEEQERIGRFAPWLLVEIPTAKDQTLRLCDFATAGSTGGRYVSWLPARKIAPPPPVPATPVDGTAVPRGRMLFTWRRPLAADPDRQHTVLIAATADMKEIVLRSHAVAGDRVVIADEQAGHLKPGVDYYWKLIARNAWGATESLTPAKRFHVDPALPPLAAEDLTEFGEGPDGVIVRADLAGDPKPSFGRLIRAQGHAPAAGIDGTPKQSIQLDGKTGMLVYALRAFPSHDYSVALWVAHEHRDDRLGQIFSAWDHAMDDPLRICIDKGQLFARIEAGSAYSTSAVNFERGRWHHVAVVKAGTKLTLYLDGKPAAETQVPGEVVSSARDFAIGGNPHYTQQSEHLACRVARLVLHARSSGAAEVAEMYEKERAR